MFELERSISDWRRQILAAGIRHTSTLQELENHLREDFRALVAAGESEEKAFRLAVSRLGTPASIQTEFKKIRPASAWPARIGLALWVAAIVGMSIFLSRRLFSGRLNFITCLHVLCITAGYGAAFWACCFGVCDVWMRGRPNFTQNRRRSLAQACSLFVSLALGLAVIGTLLALPISKQLFGVYWSWDPKEIGALCVCGWFLALTVMRRMNRITESAAILMSIGGSVVVSLAWFGAGLIDHSRVTHHSSTGPWLYLLALVAIQLVFVMVGMCREKLIPKQMAE